MAHPLRDRAYPARSDLVRLNRELIERSLVKAVHDGVTDAFILCEDCDDALATETWDARPYLNEQTHLCERCADKRRDRWLERHS